MSKYIHEKYIPSILLGLNKTTETLVYLSINGFSYYDEVFYSKEPDKSIIVHEDIVDTTIHKIPIDEKELKIRKEILVEEYIKLRMFTLETKKEFEEFFQKYNVTPPRIKEKLKEKIYYNMTYSQLINELYFPIVNQPDFIRKFLRENNYIILPEEAYNLSENELLYNFSPFIDDSILEHYEFIDKSFVLTVLSQLNKEKWEGVSLNSVKLYFMKIFNEYINKHKDKFIPFIQDYIHTYIE